MFSLGFGEIILVAIIALIFIGPEQLPEVAKVVARLLNEWRKATSDLTGSLTENLKDDIKGRIEETRKAPQAPSIPDDPEIAPHPPMMDDQERKDDNES